LLATHKPDSVPPSAGWRSADDNHLSGPSITLGLNPSLTLGICGTLWFAPEHDLAPRKDLAVSSPLFYPYGGTRPTSLGSGLPPAFTWGRFCSHLYAYARRLLAATLSCFKRTGVRTFLPAPLLHITPHHASTSSKNKTIKLHSA